MPPFTTLIVGAYFRPPAKQVLAVLPAGAELQLQPEDENPHDPNAVKVFVPVSAIPESQLTSLAEVLPDAGYTLEQVMSGGTVWLGYVPAAGGKPMQKALAAGEPVISNVKVRELMLDHHIVKLSFAPDGSPRAHIYTPDFMQPVGD